MDDTRKASPVSQNNEDVDRDYDAEKSGSKDQRGQQSRSGRTAGDVGGQAQSEQGQMGDGSRGATTSGRSMSGQRSQSDAEDGLGSSTTGRAAKSSDRLRNADDVKDSTPETDVEDEDEDEDEATSEEELR